MTIHYVQFWRNFKENLNRLRQDKRDMLGRDRRNRPYESIGPIWMGQRISSGEATGAYSQVIYNKGGWVLHMIRMMLYDPRSQNAEERFMRMMQDFCSTHHNQAASTGDFQRIVEKHMTPAMDLERNGKMDWFFRQYVYGTGWAEYKFGYGIEALPDGRFKVTGKVIRSGASDGWKDILPIYLQREGRVFRAGWVNAVAAETPFEFTLPWKPEKLTLNENEDILAEIKQ